MYNINKGYNDDKDDDDDDDDSEERERWEPSSFFFAVTRLKERLAKQNKHFFFRFFIYRTQIGR